MKPFRERNPIPIGILGTVGVLAALVVAFNFDSLPLINNTTSYTAEFVDASGLKEGDDVQVAGVKVGKVKEIELNGAIVEIVFTVGSGTLTLGDQTGAAIKVQTALGRRFLELESSGRDELRSGDVIPISRTRASFDVSQSLSDLTSTVADTDVSSLSTALESTGDVLANLPPNLRDSLTGLGRLSDTISSRDATLASLLTHANGVSGVLAERDQQLAALFGDGSALFDAINRRADTVHSLLINVEAVSKQLNAVVAENRDALGPTLDQLNDVLTLLQNNYGNLNESLIRAAPFVRQIGESVATGPYFGVIIQNLIPADLRGQIASSFGGPR
ncbi:MCE family protein [Rhodococcus erythropolis]